MLWFAALIADYVGTYLGGARGWQVRSPGHVAEQALAAAGEERRAGLARDAYSFLHLPLVAGIVLLALGLKKVMAQVGDTSHYSLSDPLKGAALAALVGGVVLYVLAHAAFQLRTTGLLNRARLVVGLLLVPLAWLGSALPALATLTLLTTIVAALVAFESLRGAGEGHRFRAS